MSEEQANYGKSFDAFDKMMRQKPRPPRPGEENAYTKKRAESGEPVFVSVATKDIKLD